MKAQNPYDILEIPRDSTNEAVKERFRKLALKLHPDVGGDWASFIRVRDAYESIVKPPETVDQKAVRFAESMEKAVKWSRTTEGFAAFGGLEFSRSDNNSMNIDGRMFAGQYSHEGDITACGGITGKHRGKLATELRGRNVALDGNVMCGALLSGENIQLIDAHGERRRGTGSLMQRLFGDDSLVAMVEAENSVNMRGGIGPAVIRGKTVEVERLEDGCEVYAEDFVMRGNIISRDCKITVSRSLRLDSKDESGIHDKCKVSWPGGSTTMKKIKGMKAGNGASIVRSGEAVTVETLQAKFGKRRWFGRG